MIGSLAPFLFCGCEMLNDWRHFVVCELCLYLGVEILSCTWTAVNSGCLPCLISLDCICVSCVRFRPAVTGLGLPEFITGCVAMEHAEMLCNCS